MSDCCEDGTRMPATFRQSQHAQMVWRVANMFATSRAHALCSRNLENNTTNGREKDKNELIRCGKLNGDVASILVIKLRGCYEETAPV